jgi:hypothetical protein
LSNNIGNSFKNWLKVIYSWISICNESNNMTQKSHWAQSFGKNHFAFKIYFFFFSLFFGSTGVWTQDLALVIQVLYHLSPTSNHLCFSYFLNRVLLLCLGQPRPWSSYLRSSCSWNDRCTLPQKHYICLDGLLQNIFSGLTPNYNPSISTSWVARITDLRHATWLICLFFR